ncbi:amidohydrolase [Aquaticitalea lipolytica]|mgnify:FL=1|uniref:Omega-amidase YafV n=1 Tax=Aquaticitalea lipolytica TaxID=1247562 RepID=A0A8J2XG73_9FLAO|nr:amidohydrolase [Aquaticitalea lipolytica]
MVWENPSQNRLNFLNKIDSITQPVDIIVLPEMFTSGFTMNPKGVAETMQGETVSWMKSIASKKQAAITGSLIIKENDNYYNRLLFVHPNGEINSYDKRHTFTLAGEDKVYTAGTKKLIVAFKGWSICPLICYDLRFPVWARNTENYEVLIYVANWPKPRVNAWDALLKARAIENMSYCIGVNRVGLDANNHEYSGHSAAYDVLGNRLDTTPFDKEAISIVTLDKTELENYRNKLNFLNDKDEFTLK